MKRLLIMAFTLIMAVSVIFGGCDRKGEESKDAPEVTDEQNTGTSAVTEEKPPADPFGKYSPSVKVKWAKQANPATDFPEGDSYENSVWTRSLLEDMGIELELDWQVVDKQYETKMNLAIASNQLPDIMSLTDYTQFNRLAGADRIVDLTELYEDYASPLLKQYLMEDGGLSKSWATIGGKLMGLPRNGVNFQTTRKIFIRRDWFEESGMDKPETMEDVFDIARAFKNKDPERRYGLTLAKKILDDGLCDMRGVCNAVGAYPRAWIEDSSGNLVYGSVQPEMKKAIGIYADLHEEGLIDPEFAVKEAAQVAKQLTSGQIGISIGSFFLPGWPLSALYKSEGIEWDIYPLLPMSDYKGELKLLTNTPKGDMHVVRKGFKHPEVLLKIMNYEILKVSDPDNAEQEKFQSDENYNYAVTAPLYPIYGPLNKNFKTNVSVTKAIDNNDTSYIVTPQEKVQHGRVKAYFDAVNSGQTPKPNEWKAYKLFYGPDSSFGIQNYYFDNDMYITSKLVGFETPEMSRKKLTLETLEDTAVVAMITGSKPLDYFDEYVQEWRDLGGELIEYEVNEWWNSKK